MWYVYNIGILFVHTTKIGMFCNNVMYIIMRIKEILGFSTTQDDPAVVFLPTPQDVRDL